MHYVLKDQYPIETEEHVKTAVDYFDKYLKRFSPVERVTAAVNIEKRATVLNMPLERGWITNYSRMFKDGAAISPDFDRNIKLRKEACISGNIQIEIGDKKIDAVELLDKIATLKSNGEAIKLIEALTEFDKQANLQYHYDNRIVDPILTVFGSLVNPEYDAVKIAEDLTNYDVVRISRDSTKIEKLAEMFSSKFAEKFKQDPVQAVSLLGAPAKKLFVETVE